MTANILYGAAIAARMAEDVRREVQSFRAAGVVPHLAAVQVGEPPASRVYTRTQAKACQDAGVGYELLCLPATADQDQLRRTIEELNGQRGVTGIIVQLPLPDHMDQRVIRDVIDPCKDVEGVNALNYGRLFGRLSYVAPCTALAAVELLKATGIRVAGLEAVVVGHSEIVGKPIAMVLLQSADQAPTVTVCHVATRDLAAHTRRADILFVATGVRQSRWLRHVEAVERGERPAPPDLSPLISADMVKPGAVVIDVATNRIPARLDEAGAAELDEQGRVRLITVGDVDFQAVSQVAGHISPVPGGVGPVTVQMLLRNTLACARKQEG
jgi:methylenetetrahydrofolate dehydrogenase (NADP+)/methenyltetrahydrofolate cyclohydrolase